MRVFFVLFILIGVMAAQAQTPTAEDNRLTYVKGFLMQVYSRALTEPKATTDQLYESYKDRFVQAKATLETEGQYQARIERYKKLVENLINQAHFRVSENELFHELRLGTNEEILLSPDVVAWTVNVPPGTQTDIPGVRVFKLLFLLADQHTLKGEKVTKGQEDWKIRDIVLGTP